LVVQTRIIFENRVKKENKSLQISYLTIRLQGSRIKEKTEEEERKRLKRRKGRGEEKGRTGEGDRCHGESRCLCRQHFELFDLNGDGVISARELRKVSRQMGYRLDDSQIEVPSQSC